jgi:hypothetical protein
LHGNSHGSYYSLVANLLQFPADDEENSTSTYYGVVHPSEGVSLLFRKAVNLARGSACLMDAG